MIALLVLEATAGVEAEVGGGGDYRGRALPFLLADARQRECGKQRDTLGGLVLPL